MNTSHPYAYLTKQGFYNAYSVVMLTDCMLSGLRPNEALHSFLCAANRSVPWSVRRTRKLSFIWWAIRWHVKEVRCCELQRFHRYFCTASNGLTLVLEASFADSSIFPMPIAVASLSKYWKYVCMFQPSALQYNNIQSVQRWQSTLHHNL